MSSNARSEAIASMQSLAIPVTIAINPAQVVPKGPVLDLDRPHGRVRLSRPPKAQRAWGESRRQGATTAGPGEGK